MYKYIYVIVDAKISHLIMTIYMYNYYNYINDKLLLLLLLADIIAFYKHKIMTNYSKQL